MYVYMCCRLYCLNSCTNTQLKDASISDLVGIKKKKFIHIHMNIYFASLIATRLKHATCFVQNFLSKFLSRNFSAMYNNNIIHCMITTQKSKLFSENIFLRNYLENYYRNISNRILFQILRSYLLLYIITLSL